MCVLRKIDKKRKRIRRFYKYFYTRPKERGTYSLWYHPGTVFPKGYPIGKWIDSHSFVTPGFLRRNPFVGDGKVRTPYGFQGYVGSTPLVSCDGLEQEVCLGRLRLCKIKGVVATGEDRYGYAAVVARHIKICTIKETKKSLGI